MARSPASSVRAMNVQSRCQSKRRLIVCLSYANRATRELDCIIVAEYNPLRRDAGVATRAQRHQESRSALCCFVASCPGGKAQCVRISLERIDRCGMATLEFLRAPTVV